MLFTVGRYRQSKSCFSWKNYKLPTLLLNNMLLLYHVKFHGALLKFLWLSFFPVINIKYWEVRALSHAHIIKTQLLHLPFECNFSVALKNQEMRLLIAHHTNIKFNQNGDFVQSCGLYNQQSTSLASIQSSLTNSKGWSLILNANCAPVLHINQ